MLTELSNKCVKATDYVVPQLRISLVSDQFGVQKTSSNNFHIYTLSKLCFIQRIRVMHCAQE